MQEIARTLSSWMDDHMNELPHAAGPRRHAQVKDPVADLATDIKTAKKDRDAVDEEAVGGLRNPNKAVARNVHLRRMGRRLRNVLNEVVTNDEYATEVDGAVDLLGKPHTKGFTCGLLDATYFALAK